MAGLVLGKSFLSHLRHGTTGLHHHEVGEIGVAAIWTRDGRIQRTVLHLTRAALDQQDATQQKEGFRIEDVAGYVNAQGEDRYAAVWVKCAAKEETGFYAGVLDKEQGHKQMAFQSRKRAPATIHAFVRKDGQPRFSGVWERPPVEELDYDFCKDVREADYVKDVRLDRAQLDVYVTQSEDNRRVYGAVLVGRATQETIKVQGLEPHAHRKRCRELLNEGWRPVALAVADFPLTPIGSVTWYKAACCAVLRLPILRLLCARPSATRIVLMIGTLLLAFVPPGHIPDLVAVLQLDDKDMFLPAMHMRIQHHLKRTLEGN